MASSGAPPLPVRPEPLPEAEVDALRNHPRMADAIRRTVSVALAFADSDDRMKVNMGDVGRWFLGLLALYLDATGGLTHRRLRELSGRTTMISAGRATAMIWQLQRIGYIVPVADLENGRRRDYVLTPAMVEAFTSRMAQDYTAVTIAVPDLANLAARIKEPRVMRAICAVVGQDVIGAATNPLPETEAMSVIATRNAGLLILFNILADADTGAGAFPPVGPARCSVSAMAKRFSVSRSHVSRVLGEMESLGLIDRLGPGEVKIRPELAPMMATFYSHMYVGARNTLRRAEALLAADPDEIAQAAE